MPYVRIIEPSTAGAPGDVIEVPQADARRMVAAGYAEKVSKADANEHASAIETAALNPLEVESR